MLATVQDYIDAELTHSVHTTGARSFRGCRRRWNWIFNEFYYPKLTPKPLEFGVAFHEAMEVLYDPKLWDKPEDVVVALAQQRFFEACKRQFNKFRETLGEGQKVDPDVVEDYKERVELGKKMLKYHAENARRKDIAAELKPVLVEQKFEVPLEKDGEQIWCKCNVCWSRYKVYTGPRVNITTTTTSDKFERASWQGLPVTYGGRIDCIMMGPDGRMWVVDWKTAARLSDETAAYLLNDDQITRYLAAMRLCGYRVAGFIYHEIRKAVPEEPEPLTRRYMGKLYSTNKQQPYEWRTFEETVKDNDPEAYEDGLYDAFIEYLREADQRFYARHPIPRNDAELDNAWQNVIEEALDMIDPNLRLYPNAGRFNCGNCAFQQPCLEKNSNGDVEYTLKSMFDKRNYHYWEDAKPDTDKSGRMVLDA